MTTRNRSNRQLRLRPFSATAALGVGILALVLTLATAYADITTGLVGHWTFDEGAGTTAADSSTYGNNGTLVNGPTWTTGKLGSAVSLDGVNDYVRTTPVPFLGTSNRSYTFATWVNVAPGETAGNIVHMSSGSNGVGWCLPMLSLIDGKFRAISWLPGSVTAFSTTEPAAETWYHIATTWDATNGLRIFVNGVLEGSTAQATYSGSGTSNYIWFGFTPNSCAGNTGWFAGSVDDGRVYNRALTEAEIATLASLHIPDITTTSLPDGTIGVPYSQTPALLGGNGPFTWSVIAGALPDGLSLNAATGEISGDATTENTYAFTVQVLDDRGEIDSQALTITIVVPAVLTNSLPNGAVGVAYSETLVAGGGTPPYTWSITAGALPTGLSLNTTTGEVSGTPDTPGVATFTVQVQDDLGGTDDQELTLSIDGDPVVSTVTLPDGTLNGSYAQTLAVSGGTSPFTWSVTVGALPDGLSLDAGSGAITGTPTIPGAVTFTVEVTDSNAKTDDQELTLTVNDELLVTTSAVASGTVGDPYSQVVAASGGTPPLSWSIAADALPAGLALDPTTAEIAGTPATSETATFTVQVIDAAGATADRSLSITVFGAGVPSSPTPDPDPDLTETSFIVTPGDPTGGIAGTSPDGCVRVEVAASAVSAATVFTLSQPGVPDAPAGTEFYSPCTGRVLAELEASGQALTEFDDPFTVVFTLDPTDAASLGDAEVAGALTLAYWDGEEWIALPTTVDPATGEVSAPSDGTGTFALLSLAGPFFMVPPDLGLTLTGLARVGAVTGAIDLELVREACPRVSLWITVGGSFEGYVFDAPSFVNRAFPEALSRGTLTIVRCH